MGWSGGLTPEEEMECVEEGAGWWMDNIDRVRMGSGETKQRQGYRERD